MRENFRDWIETLETFGREVISEERRGKRAAILRGLLFGSSKIYTIAIKFYRLLYDVRILRDWCGYKRHGRPHLQEGTAETAKTAEKNILGDLCGLGPSSRQGSPLIMTAPSITGRLPHGPDGNRDRSVWVG